MRLSNLERIISKITQTQNRTNTTTRYFQDIFEVFAGTYAACLNRKHARLGETISCQHDRTQRDVCQPNRPLWAPCPAPLLLLPYRSLPFVSLPPCPTLPYPTLPCCRTPPSLSLSAPSRAPLPSHVKHIRPTAIQGNDST